MVLIVIALIVFLLLWLIEKAGRKKEKKANKTETNKGKYSVP